MFGALKPGFQSLATLKLVVNGRIPMLSAYFVSGVPMHIADQQR